MKKNSVLILFFILSPFALAGKINSFDIGYETLKEYFSSEDYVHFKFVGICSWIKKNSWPYPPSYIATPEIDYFYPDLVVSVFNKTDDNPWNEADIMLDQPAKGIISDLVKNQLGYELGGSSITDAFNRTSSIGIRRKVVDVIGHPNTLIKPPLPIFLRSDTYPLVPYYQSQIDILNTVGAAESITRPVETFSIVSGFIGNPVNHWGYMFPREMSAIINNDFKASLVFAIRAAHIVTNRNAGHIVNSINNTCGINCRVASMAYDPEEKYIKWQEIYPNNRRIKLGEVDTALTSMGNNDFNKGNGNYVFVVWRRYQGCVQAPTPEYKLSKRFTSKIYSPTVRT